MISFKKNHTVDGFIFCLLAFLLNTLPTTHIHSCSLCTSPIFSSLSTDAVVLGTNEPQHSPSAAGSFRKVARVRASGSRKFNISITASTQVRDSFGAAGKKETGRLLISRLLMQTSCMRGRVCAWFLTRSVQQ